MNEIIETYHCDEKCKFKISTDHKPNITNDTIHYPNVETILFSVYLFIGKENSVNDSYNLPINHRMASQPDVMRNDFLKTINVETKQNMKAIYGNEIIILPYELGTLEDDEINNDVIKPIQIVRPSLDTNRPIKENKDIVFTWEIENLFGKCIEKNRLIL